jgi:hypothetical protein
MGVGACMSRFHITAILIPKTQQRYEAFTPRRQHHHRLRAAGSHRIRIFFLYGERIYYHVID